MTIQFSPDLEKALADEARRLGTTRDLLANECLRQRLAPTVAQPSVTKGAKNLAEYLADYIGVLSSEKVPGGARMSENTGKKFTEIVVEKHRQRRK